MGFKTVLTTVIAGSEYLIHPQILGTIHETIYPDVIIPVTVLESDQVYHGLEDTLRLFALYDDVFTPEFGTVLIEKPTKNSSKAISSVGPGKPVLHLRNDTSGIARRAIISDLPVGPYILHGPNVHQAWKIYDDTLDAFTSGVYPDTVDESDRFEVLQLPARGANNHAGVPVPSKLYSTAPPEEAPLKGYRFTVPDSMSLKGVASNVSSASWSQLHGGTADATAAFAKRLIDLGAVIVGKTKSSQFGSGREWQDVAAPKNPREDEHQDAAGGPTGAATALGGYEWLKASAGFDAIGQTFETAAAQGLFALRTTPGVLSLDDTQINAPKLDAISLLATDVSELFHHAVAIVHESLSSPPVTFPKQLISLTDLDEADNKQKKKHGEFVAAIEAFLRVKSKNIALQELWTSKSPAEANGQALQDYMKNAPFYSFCYEYYRQYDAFRKEYHDKYGKEPAVEATVSYRWDTGKEVSDAQYKDYQNRIAVFQKWFNDNIMTIGEKGDAVLVMPYASDAPRYTHPLPSTIRGITPGLLSSLLQTPQILAPFSQFPYNSSISHQTEYHPIYATILGPVGSDTALVKLVEATFQHAQWRTKVDKGRFTFPPG